MARLVLVQAQLAIFGVDDNNVAVQAVVLAHPAQEKQPGQVFRDIQAAGFQEQVVKVHVQPAQVAAAQGVGPGVQVLQRPVERRLGVCKQAAARDQQDVGRLILDQLVVNRQGSILADDQFLAQLPLPGQHVVEERRLA